MGRITSDWCSRRVCAYDEDHFLPEVIRSATAPESQAPQNQRLVIPHPWPRRAVPLIRFPHRGAPPWLRAPAPAHLARLSRILGHADEVRRRRVARRYLPPAHRQLAALQGEDFSVLSTAAPEGRRSLEIEVEVREALFFDRIIDPAHDDHLAKLAQGVASPPVRLVEQHHRRRRNLRAWFLINGLSSPCRSEEFRSFVFTINLDGSDHSSLILSLLNILNTHRRGEPPARPL